MVSKKQEQSEASPAQELVPLEVNGELVHINSEPVKLRLYATTFDTKNRADVLELMSIMMGAGDNAEVYVNTRFRIRHVTIFPKEYLPDKETGEVVEATWSVITTDKGDNIAFHSPGILQSLRALIALGGKPPFDHLGEFILTRRQTAGKDGNPHFMYILRPAKASD